MVLEKIKEALKTRRERKAQEAVEIERLESYRESEQMQKAEQIKKEADRLAHLKQYQSAIDEYHKALEVYAFDEKEAAFRKPAEFFFKIYFNVAASYSFLNRFDKAIQYFDRALLIGNIDNENKSKALMSKGNCFYKSKQLLKGDYADIVSNGKGEHDPSDEKAFDSLKKRDDKEGLFNLALECFSATTDLDKHNADAWYRKGHMEFLLGKVKEAMLSFDKVLEIEKGFENKERISLFDDIRMEKGIKVKASQVIEEEGRFKTKTGHYVRNKAEKMIANFLFENNLLFQHDVAISWADKDEFKAGFYMPKLDLYIEHFNFDKVKPYEKFMKWKIKQYEKNKKKLVYTTSDDEVNIEEALKIKMKPYIML